MWTDGQMKRKKKQTDGDRWTDGKKEKKTERRMDREKNRQTDGHTY